MPGYFPCGAAMSNKNVAKPTFWKSILCHIQWKSCPAHSNMSLLPLYNVANDSRKTVFLVEQHCNEGIKQSWVSSPFKWFQLCPTFIQPLLNRSLTVNHLNLCKKAEQSIQMASTPSNIFQNKENIEAMLNGSLNQFQWKKLFVSTCFKNVFNVFFFLNHLNPLLLITA